jgi:hypothetical protein
LKIFNKENNFICEVYFVLTHNIGATEILNPGNFIGSFRKMFDTGSTGGNGGDNSKMPNNKNKPHSFQKKKNKNNNSGDNKGNYSVTTTTSKAKTPLPPNQEKKVNNKRAAKRKREKLLEISRNSNQTPLSATSETRTMLDEMELNEEAFYSSDSEVHNMATDVYKELSTDALILNTETVEKIIEKIATDIEESEEFGNEHNSNSDSDEFGEEEALNAGVKRYFIESSGPKCFNCGESGHILKDCPASSTVPCNLCGQVGHSRFNCPQEVCYNCSRPGHQSKACPSRRKRRVYDDDLCNRCGQPGHLVRECSMAWRGYVFARDLPRSHASFINELRGLRKRCYNCASISHFGDDCPNRRRPNYSVFHIPDYDYLDRVILRIKASSSHAKKEAPNAKQIQADNLKKIIENSGGKNNSKQAHQTHQIQKNKQNNQSNNDHAQQQHKHQHHKQPVNDYEDDFTMYEDEEFDDSHKEHLSNAKSVNRKVFLQSRGIVEENQIKKPIPFVHYEGNQIKVKKYDDDEDESIKKGSSKKHHQHNKPSYRGGYK